MIDYREISYVGAKKIPVTKLGLGCLSIGWLYKEMSKDAAIELIKGANELGINLYDTSPLYGALQSEWRLGFAFKDMQREKFTISTKVGYDVTGFTPETVLAPIFPPRYFDYDFTMRSVEASMKRMRVEFLDIVHIHDADTDGMYKQAMEGAYRALEDLRSQGVIGAIGAGMNYASSLARMARNGDFDAFLMAGRYSLMDHVSCLNELFPVALEKKVAIFCGGVFSSGIMANPHAKNARFNYQPATPEVFDKVRNIDKICKRYNVPLQAATVQFPTFHPAVKSIVLGCGSLERLKENITMLEYKIPVELWAELKSGGYIHEAAPVPGR
jgi:D-threo-aldose 1-dehydrogenase